MKSEWMNIIIHKLQEEIERGRSEIQIKWMKILCEELQKKSSENSE